MKLLVSDGRLGLQIASHVTIGSKEELVSAKLCSRLCSVGLLVVSPRIEITQAEPFVVSRLLNGRTLTATLTDDISFPKIQQSTQSEFIQIQRLTSETATIASSAAHSPASLARSQAHAYYQNDDATVATRSRSRVCCFSGNSSRRWRIN